MLLSWGNALDVFLFSTIGSVYYFSFALSLWRQGRESRYFGVILFITFCVSAHLAFLTRKDILGGDPMDLGTIRAVNGALIASPICAVHLARVDVHLGEKIATLSIVYVLVASGLLYFQPDIFGSLHFEDSTRQVALFFTFAVSTLISAYLGSSTTKRYPFRLMIAFGTLYIPLGCVLPLQYLNACSTVKMGAYCGAVNVWGTALPLATLVYAFMLYRKSVRRWYSKWKPSVHAVHAIWSSHTLILIFCLSGIYIALRVSDREKAGIVLTSVYAGGFFWIFGNSSTSFSPKKKFRALKAFCLLFCLAGCTMMTVGLFYSSKVNGREWLVYTGAALAVETVALSAVWSVLFKFRDTTIDIVGHLASVFLSNMCCWLVLIPIGLIMPIVFSASTSRENSANLFRISIPLVCFTFLLFVVGCTIAANRMFHGMEKEKQAKRSAQELRKRLKLLNIKVDPEVLRYVVDYHHAALREEHAANSKDKKTRGSNRKTEMAILPMTAKEAVGVDGTIFHSPISIWEDKCRQKCIVDVVDVSGTQHMLSAEDVRDMKKCERCLSGNGEVVFDEHDNKLVSEGRPDFVYTAAGKSRGLSRLCSDCYVILSFDNRTEIAKEKIRLKNASYEEKQKILKAREERKQRNLKRKNDLIKAAHGALQRGNIDEAIASYTLAFEFCSSKGSLFIMRSVAFLQAEKFENALEDASNAFEANPRLVRALTLKADIYEQQCMYEAQVEHLEKAIDLLENGKGDDSGCKGMGTLKAILSHARERAESSTVNIPKTSVITLFKTAMQALLGAFVALLKSPHTLIKSILICFKRGSKSVAGTATAVVHDLQDDIIDEINNNELDKKINEMRSRVYTNKYKSNKIATVAEKEATIAEEAVETPAQEKSIEAITTWFSETTTIVAVRCVGLELEPLGKNYLQRLLSSDGYKSVSGIIANSKQFHCKGFHYDRFIGRSTSVDNKDRHDIQNIGINGTMKDARQRQFIEWNTEEYFFINLVDGKEKVKERNSIKLSVELWSNDVRLRPGGGYVIEDVGCIGSVLLTESALRSHGKMQRCLEFDLTSKLERGLVTGGRLTLSFKTVTFDEMLRARLLQTSVVRMQRFSRRILALRRKAYRTAGVARVTEEIFTYYSSIITSRRPPIYLNPSGFIDITRYSGSDRITRDQLRLIFEDAEVDINRALQILQRTSFRRNIRDNSLNRKAFEKVIFDIAKDLYNDVFPLAAYQFFVLKTCEAKLPMYKRRRAMLSKQRDRRSSNGGNIAKLKRNAAVHKAALIISRAIRRWRKRTNLELGASLKIQAWFRRFKNLNKFYRAAKSLKKKIDSATIVQKFFRQYLARRDAADTMASIRILLRLEKIKQAHDEKREVERRAAEEARAKERALARAREKFKKSKLLAIVNWMGQDDEDGQDAEEAEEQEDYLPLVNEKNIIESVKGIIYRRLDTRREWKFVCNEVISALRETKPKLGPWASVSTEDLKVDWTVKDNIMEVLGFVKETYTYTTLAIQQSVWTSFSLSAKELMEKGITHAVYNTSSTNATFQFADLANATSSTFGADIVEFMIALPQFSFSGADSFIIVFCISAAVCAIFPFFVQRGIRRSRKGILGIDDRTHRVASLWTTEGSYTFILGIVDTYLYFGVILNLLSAFSCDYSDPDNIVLKRDTTISCFSSFISIHTALMAVAAFSICMFFPLATLLAPNFALTNKALDIKFTQPFMIMSSQAQLFVAAVAVFYGDSHWGLVLIPEAIVLAALFIVSVAEKPCIITYINKYKSGSLLASLCAVSAAIGYNLILDLVGIEKGSKAESNLKIATVIVVIVSWICIAAKLRYMVPAKEKYEVASSAYNIFG